jgi:hypothetical protein
MRFDRYTVAAVVGTVTLLAGGGTALAGKSDDGNRGTRCEARLAKIAERRGVTVEQLTADIKAKLLARVTTALEAGTITSERAAMLRQRIAGASLCQRLHRHAVRHGVHGLLGAAADYLGLSRAELRLQLPGTSLSALAQKHGKSIEGLKAAMLGPANERLAKAVETKSITQARADERLEKLENLVDRLVVKTFKAKDLVNS